MDNMNVPVPDRPEVEELHLEPGEVTADMVNDEILGQNNDGYCPCTIVAMIEELHDVDEETDFDDISEDQREIIEQATVEYCTADIYSIDGNYVNLILKFDTPQDGYLRDLVEMLENYKESAMDHVNNKKSVIPMFSLTFLPDKFEGKYGAGFFFPVSFFRTLDGNDQETCLHMIYNMENVSYEKYDIDDDTMAEIEADVLREIEQNAALNGDDEDDGIERQLFQ